MHAPAKRLALTLARGSGFFAIVRGLTHPRLRVLAYHGVEEVGGIGNADGFQVAPDTFAQHLEHIIRRYRPVSLGAVCAARAGGAPLPDRALLVTFDDGYLNNAEVAAPLLKKFGVPAAFFITTGYIDGTEQPWWYVLRHWLAEAGAARVGLPGGGRADRELDALVAWERRLKGLTHEQRARELEALGTRLGLPPRVEIPFMNWAQVARLQHDGFDVGAHTVRHVNLGAEPPGVARAEVEDSVRRLRRETGAPVRAIAYPYGRAEDVQEAVDEAAAACGLVAGFTTIHGLNRPDTPSLRLHRLNVTDHYRGLAFEKLLALG
jgi:peptidoglycan/xylan/chitin deacetylase (PgdA/CDA1 family)